MISSNGAGREEEQSTSKRLFLRFRIPYFTQWGQNLLISGSHFSLGSWNVKQGLSMTPHHQGNELIWSAQITVQEPFEAFKYSYCVVDEKKILVRKEAGDRRELDVLSGSLGSGSFVDIYDFWQEFGPESLLKRSAFTDAIFRGLKASSDAASEKSCELVPPPTSRRDEIVVRFQVSCANLEKGQTVWLTGDCDELGNWDFGSAMQMIKICGDSVWRTYAAIGRNEFPIKYSYVLKDMRGETSFESGDGRKLTLDSFRQKPASLILVSDGNFRGILWKGAGVAVPVFSIRSREDVGVGEFLDLKLLIDFASKTGLRLLQLLPVNDTSVNGMWWDSYPYSSLSVMALHPLYLRLEAMSKDIPSDIKEEIVQARNTLNLKDVDYDATMKMKLSVAKKLFHLQKEEVLRTSEFEKYYEENEHWLKPFAVFCFLRDFFGTSDYSQWGLYSSYSKDKLDKIASEHQSAVSFVYYLQFHLHSQLSEVSEYARANGIVLKGDLPIGVDRNSVDTWAYPSLFRMNTSTGAPPDYFDKNGQNWGFPTYNWDEMSKDNYAWWRARLTQMSKYFTAYRIDHILGFFRIWELPAHSVTGLMGKFRPSIPLSQSELEERGIWDFNRLCEPYLHPQSLEEKFSNAWISVGNKYMDKREDLFYKFKAEYNTEKKILADLTSDSVHLKKPLFDLLHDVVLMRDPEDSTKFYPRFGMNETRNFNELDDYSKSVLETLYYDYFYHRQEGLWKENALKTLPVLINSSDMLTCGEDLGMVPACVPPVLKELGLLGLRIQRMPSTAGQEFGNPADYDYMTVCAPSCHDCSTLRAWWEDDEGRRNRYYKDFLGIESAPPAKCTPEVARLIIKQHMESPSMWAIFPLQDLLALRQEYSQRPAKEETINDPTNPKHYWRFRVHVPVEKLLEDEEFVQEINWLVTSAGRKM